MSDTALEPWLQRLQTLHASEIELGLDRVASVADTLRLLPLRQPVVTVAGTNGKGTTVAVLEALLQASGKRSATFTSPHLLRFNERIRVDGSDVSDAEIVAAFAAIDAARGAISLTFFEFSLLAALYIFRARAPDVVVLEVGLGGRLDAVNIVDASVAVITSIDLDHQDWLGETRDEIAREKAGVLRAGRPVIVAERDPPAALLRAIDETGARPALLLGREYSLEEGPGEWSAVLQRPDGRFWPVPVQPRGAALPQNICAAVQAALLLGIEVDGAVFARALSRVHLPGRRQLLRLAGCEYLLDVAHNPAAVRALREYLDATPCNGKSFALFSIMADKDLSGILREISGRFDGWFVADLPGNPRAAGALEIATALRAAGEAPVSESEDPGQALRRVREIMTEGDRLVVFGSFFTVACVLPLLERRHGERQEK